MLLADRHEDDDRQIRLAGDAALCAYLRKQKYQGPDWERFVHELLAYGLTQTKIMIEVMGIAPTATRNGTFADRGDLDELVSDIVMGAFRLFVRRGLVGGEWVPEKGASLTTYFTGACKLVLREKSRDWRNRAQRSALEVPHSLVPENGFRRDLGWHFDDYFDRVIEQLTPVERRIFFLKSEGLSYAEVGTRLDLSERAVERRINRARNRINAKPSANRGGVVSAQIMSSDSTEIFARLKSAAFHELVTSSMAGDREAVATLFAWIRPAIIRYCRSRIGRSGLAYSSADDVAQEICVATLGALTRYRDEPESFLPFVYGIAAHKVADHYRRAGHNRSDPTDVVPDGIDHGAEEAFDQIASAAPSNPKAMANLLRRSSLGEEAALVARGCSHDHRLDARASTATNEILSESDTYSAIDLRDRLAQLLETLPPKQRQILHLRLIVGLSAQETAAAVGLTPTAVRVTQHRALAKLRAAVVHVEWV